jgi:hypothetical protein
MPVTNFSVPPRRLPREGFDRSQPKASVERWSPGAGRGLPAQLEGVPERQALGARDVVQGVVQAQAGRGGEPICGDLVAGRWCHSSAFPRQSG